MIVGECDLTATRRLITDKFEEVTEFKFLGTWLTNDERCDTNILKRVSEAKKITEALNSIL